MRDAECDRGKALELLREHSAGKDKLHVVGLYCELKSLQKANNETVTDYIIQAEIILSLRRADEQISDGLQIAMVSDSYKPFVMHISQTNIEKHIVTFGEFKTKL